MKHIAIIQSEFLKTSYESSDFKRYDWDVWTREQQEKYLRKHPESKKKLTAIPSNREMKSRKIHALLVKSIYKRFAPRFKQAGYKLPEKLTLDLLPKESPLLGWGTKKGIWASPDYFRGSNIKALKRLMLHEMCHVAIETKYLHHPWLLPKEHGAEFRALARQVGADPSTRGSEEDRWIGVPVKDRKD